MTAPGCLEPDGCPVPDPAEVDLRRLRVAHLEAGRTCHTAYRRRHWPALFNQSGRGDARFSPLVGQGRVVPTMYAAVSQTVALLETSFHDLHQLGSRIISEQIDLAARGLVTLSVPARLTVVDLRDDALRRLGVDRQQLITTSRAHYPCTRAWAAALHGRRVGSAEPVGLLWNSRVAELARQDSILFADLLSAPTSEVFVLFGDGVPTEPMQWHPGEPHYDDLTTGDGRVLAEQIAEQLDAVIVSAA